MRWLWCVVAAGCSSQPASHPADEPPVAPAPAVRPAEPERPLPAGESWVWPRWSGCTPPSADEAFVLDPERGLLAVDARTGNSRVYIGGVDAAAIDPLHDLLWFSGNDGLWTLALDSPCAPPVAAMLGYAPGDFGITFGRLELSTNCASHQLEWDLSDPTSLREPMTARPSKMPGKRPETMADTDDARINHTFLERVAAAGPGTPHRALGAGAVPLGSTGATLVLGAESERMEVPCSLRRGGVTRSFGNYRRCPSSQAIYLDRDGKRWLFGNDLCDAAGCRRWRGDDVAYPVGWPRPGEILTFKRQGEGC